MRPGRTAGLVGCLAMLLGAAHASSQEKNYLVTVSAVDVGMSTHGLCVAVDEADAKGVFWWEPGKGGQCSTRSSSLMPAEQPSASRTASGSIDVRFRLQLIAREEKYLDVALSIDGAMMRGMSGTRVALVRRNDLNIPEACCLVHSPGSNGPLSQWPNGPMTQWPNDPMTQWPNGPLTQ